MPVEPKISGIFSNSHENTQSLTQIGKKDEDREIKKIAGKSCF